MPSLSTLHFFEVFLILSPQRLSYAHATGAHRRYGLVGYGIDMYNPPCGYACQHILSQSQLNCSTPPVADRWHGGSGLGFETSSVCYASDDVYLKSMAWCLQAHCGGVDEVEDWVIERYWEEDMIGSEQTRWSFSKALELAGDSFKSKLTVGEALKVTSEVMLEDWKVARNSMRNFVLNEAQHSTCGIILLLSMVLGPGVLAFVEFLVHGFSTRMQRMLLAYIIYPPIIQRRSLLRFLGEEQPPSRGHALLSFSVILLNVFLSVVNFRGSMPNIYWKSAVHMNFDTLANRVGILSFANLSVIFLYSSRNNPLIRLSGWQHSTFIQLHRWVAYLCVAQAALHSLIYFIVHVPVLSHKFTQLYWNIGFFGTTVFCIIPLTSLLFVRKRWYELFINTHVVLALAAVFACYYHVFFKFSYHWGYEYWIILVMATWGLEILARSLKIARNGWRVARVQEVDDEYLVIDIEGVKGVGMAYLYFPTLGWRFWENHPFSIMGSVVEKRSNQAEHIIGQGEPVFGLVGSDYDSESESDTVDGIEDPRKLSLDTRLKPSNGHLESPLIPMTPITPNSATFLVPSRNRNGGIEEEDVNDAKQSKMVTGLTFLIRREKGTTARLFTKSLQLSVLVEGPYRSHLSLATLATSVPRLICIAGGVGIAVILPILRARATASTGTTSLYFGTRSSGLVSTCGLAALQRQSTNLDIRISIGKRWDLEELVWKEAGCYELGSNGNGDDIMVVACGPSSMINGVRMAVVEANKKCNSGIVRLLYESFT